MRPRNFLNKDYATKNFTTKNFAKEIFPTNNIASKKSLRSLSLSTMVIHTSQGSKINDRAQLSVSVARMSIYGFYDIELAKETLYLTILVAFQK